MNLMRLMFLFFIEINMIYILNCWANSGLEQECDGRVLLVLFVGMMKFFGMKIKGKFYLLVSCEKK